jgi:hypothetical protein
VDGRTVRSKSARLLSGLVTSALIFGAVPAVLVLLVGIPVPHHGGRIDVLSARGLFDGLAVVAWVSWAVGCWALLRSVATMVHRGDAHAPRGSALADRLAARIAAAVLVVAPVGVAGSMGGGILGGTAGATAAATALAPPRPPSSTPVPPGLVPAPATPPVPGTGPAPGSPPPLSPRGSVSSTPVAAVEEGPNVHVIQPGESLWSIAEELYGDGADWPAIAALNLGHVMSDGTRFLDPSLIRPGWALVLPSPTVPPVPTQPAAPAPTLMRPTEDLRLVGVPAGAPGRGTATAPLDTASVDRVDLTLPELAALGLGAVAASALARRLRRRRLLAQVSRPGIEGPWSSAGAARSPGLVPASSAPPDIAAPSAASSDSPSAGIECCDDGPAGRTSEPAEDTAALLERYLDVPALDWLDRANRRLAAMTGSGQPTPRLVRVGPDGIEVWFARPTGGPPVGWSARRAGRAWHLPVAGDPGTFEDGGRGGTPWLPVLLPVGDDATGTWLLVVEPGSCLPVLGPAALDMVAAMRTAAISWPWADQVTVTDDPRVAARETALGTGRAEDPERTRTLFVGDPRRLDRSVRSSCGVLTTSPVPATDVTVVVDARAATLHPLGLTLRPHGLAPDRLAAVDELLGTADGPIGEPVRLAEGRARTRPRPASRRRPGRLAASAAPELGDLAPGSLEVRLLTPVPRVDGLPQPFPVKRARRATELVAYLALHRPGPVTGDRLRTRVLGNADADAAAQTLFNVAADARRAMGCDPDGQPYLPPGTRAGYRTSPALTVDVDRAAHLVAAGREADGDEAIALYRAALALVEGEPLSAVLSGYGWWQAEGHEGRVGALLVDAACTLSGLAAEAGHVELATWGLERARLVQPYSEALSRAAMRLAAATGDTDRLRREWLECQRRIEELDPGAGPTPATERLYAELSGRGRRSARAGMAGQASLAAMVPAPLKTVPSAPSAL